MAYIGRELEQGKEIGGTRIEERTG